MVGEANLAVSRPGAIGAIVLVVGLTLGFGSTAVLAPEADAHLSTSTLTLVMGSVFVEHAGSDPRPAQQGDVVAAGDTLRTGAGGVAEITYFEGSSVRLEGDTEILVEALRAEPDGGTVIGM